MIDEFTIVLAPFARVAFATPSTNSHFFGYFNQSPVNADGHYLLAHCVGFDGREITAADHATVGFFDLRDNTWREMGKTRAFNWQQGAMLQWLGPDFQSQVIFNDQEGDHFVARIVDAVSGNVRTLPHAIYAVHPSGRRALGVRFERHYFCRAYHYEGLRDERWNVPVHPDDGILDIDLETGAARMLLRTADIAGFEPSPAMAGSAHWLEHLVWNPSGSRFGFLHRYGTGANYSTRLFTSDGEGGNLYCLPGHAEYSYTHMGWRDDSTFVIYALRQRQLAGIYTGLQESTHPLKALAVHIYRTLRKLVPRRITVQCIIESGYALVQDRVGRQRLLTTGELWRDGHPSWSRDGRFMLTDTYADDQNQRRLLIYDAVRDKLHEVGRFLSPFNACGYRCDLHPRFSRDDRQIVIDTAHTGRHQMLVLDIAWLTRPHPTMTCVLLNLRRRLMDTLAWGISRGANCTR